MRTRLVLPGARPRPSTIRASVPEPPPPPPPEPPRPSARAEPAPAVELPAGVAGFARLAGLVPPGSWPATLPTTAGQPVLPLQEGIRQRVAALLPEDRRQALALAVSKHCKSRRYLEAVAAEGALRWSDGGEPLGPVGERDRAWAERQLAKLR